MNRQSRETGPDHGQPAKTPNGPSPGISPKQRMLNAYRGVWSDRLAVAPEFWVYYPAKLLGLDMIAFRREVPFHSALKTTFEHFGCDGWGLAGCRTVNPDAQWNSSDRWLDDETLEIRTTIATRHGDLVSRQRLSPAEPGWVIERGIKDFERDLPAWECATYGGDIAALDPTPLVRAWEEVGEAYLLEGSVVGPFFDTYAGSREGGLEQAVFDFLEHEAVFERLQEKHIDYATRYARAVCERTQVESFFIGCSWSCNSLIGPAMWRRWDKPAIRAVCDEVHRHDRLLHVHFHGRCMETVADFAEMGVDCVCPFERPPGGDIAGKSGLQSVAQALGGKTTMNGNIHTVETLIRGTPDDVRREVREVLEAFAHTPRVIVGTGDQVGRETPEENARAMIDEVKRAGRAAM